MSARRVREYVVVRTLITGMSRRDDKPGGEFGPFLSWLSAHHAALRLCDAVRGCGFAIDYSIQMRPLPPRR